MTISEVEVRVYQCPTCHALPGCYCERQPDANGNVAILTKCHATRRKVAREHANYTDERSR